MSKCKFCGLEVTWVKEGRKNVPVEGDGAVHRCEEMKASMRSIKSMEPSSLSAEEIAKYERAINEKAKK